MKSSHCFSGLMPALMTPCDANRQPQFDALCEKAHSLIQAGMNSVIYCGSMGVWPLLSDTQRQAGVSALCQSGVPVIVGTGAQNSDLAVAHARHAQEAGAAGLMLIPRVLSRGSSPSAQRAHFSEILGAAPELPAVIYNSPYYGFETRADLFFSLREAHPNLVGFKEFGGAHALSYAAEHITSGHPDLRLLIGVDTQMFHGYINCGAVGAITGIGNVLPREVVYLETLCKRAAAGDSRARQQAWELDQAMMTLATFDEGPDLVLYFKYLLTLLGEPGYEHHFNPQDRLSESQAGFAASQLALFQAWWNHWESRPH
ncbi:MAG: dihydrodipicolinate synthase family protein [Gammaproteobacteria bacterium]